VTGKAEAVTSGDGVAGVAPGPAVRPAARRRRPTGAPPPLPHPVSVSTTAWLVAVVVVLAGVIVVSVRAPSRGSMIRPTPRCCGFSRGRGRRG